MDISVVILSWNDKANLKGCLESLKNSTRRKMEVIVVDNASNDGSPEMVESGFPDVKLIRNRENLGFPKGNNVGYEASTGKYVYLLNSDIKVLPGCMDLLADYMDAHPDVGMLGPRVLNADLTHQSSCRKNPTLWNNFCTATGLTKLVPRSKVFTGEHMNYFHGDRTIEVDVLVGCFWVVRRAATDQFGLLDEGFFIYAEDVDWCQRCWKAGWKVVFYHKPEAIHYRGASTTKKDPVRFAVTQQTSVLRYWKKHHGSWGRFWMGCFLFVSSSLRLLASSVTYVIRPRARPDVLIKLRVLSACIRALFIRSVV